MAKILDVPYRSQWDADANMSNTDCGPACLAMVLGYFDKEAAINELFTATGVEPGSYVGFGQLQRVARSHNVTFEYDKDCTLDDLKRWIDEGKPAIALVKYSYWSQIEPGLSTQDPFSGPHFVVVVGYGDGNVIINDPDFWPPRREEGYRKVWSEELFELAWGNVHTTTLPNPNNSVIVPTQGKVDTVSETGEPRTVIEYIVQPGDTWSGLAGRFYNDQTRYPEILAFNNLSAGTPLYVGQKLLIPLMEEEQPQPIVLGEGAEQTVDADLVKELKEKWVGEDKLAVTADETAVLRAFLSEIEHWDVNQAEVVEYVAQPGDSWASVAGKFLGDQMRFPEIIEFNGLHPDAPLRAGQTLRIPPR